SSTSACIYYFFCFPIQRSPCSLLVPYTTLFRSHGQRTQRSAVVVQFGGPLGHPADQPDVELVVADQAGVPAFVAGQARRRQQVRSEEHTSELQSRENLVCRLLLEKKNSSPLTLY